MNVVGIVPAAGYGSRLHPFRYPKELFPLSYTPVERRGLGVGAPNGDVRLKVVCEYGFECLVEAGVERAYVVVSDHKLEILRFLSDGQEYGIRLAYLHQRQIDGLPAALDCAYEWVKDQISALVLPDTVVEPRDSVRQMVDLLRQRRVDVVLGVYPTDHPEDLCPVRYDGQMQVIELYDKRASPGLFNTWGTAVWRPTFTEYLHRYLRRAARPKGPELSLAEALSGALEEGLQILALPLAGGRFWDIGKNSSLIKARRELETGSSRQTAEAISS